MASPTARQWQVRGRQTHAVFWGPHACRIAVLWSEVGKPKRYVQDALRERTADVAAQLKDPNTCFYVCGLKSMEEGVVMALRDIAQNAGLDWDTVGAALKKEGRLHLETY